MSQADGVTWGEGTAVWTELYASVHHKAESTRCKDARVIRDFASGSTPLASITPAHVEQYVARRAAGGLSAWSQRDDVMRLKSIWRWLRKRRYVRHRPFKGLKLVDQPEVDPRPPAIEHVRTLRQYLAAHNLTMYLRLVTLAANVDLRVRELLAMTTADVRLDGDPPVLTVRGVKPPHYVDTIKLNTEALNVLRPLVWEVGSGLLFRTRDGMPLHRCVVSHMLARYADRAGVPGVTFHSLRKLCSTKNGERYTDRQLMLITRHRDVKSVGHYVRPECPMPVEVVLQPTT